MHKYHVTTRTQQAQFSERTGLPLQLANSPLENDGPAPMHRRRVHAGNIESSLQAFGLQLRRDAVANAPDQQHLAALRVLFDWLAVGKPPVLTAEEARAMLDAINIATPVGLRDRALIGLMVYTFARVGAAIGMRVEDVYVQGRRTWVRLHEKGGKGQGAVVGAAHEPS